LSRNWARKAEAELRFVLRSDDVGEFGECNRDASAWAGIDPES
jgi:hypothetical protein